MTTFKPRVTISAAFCYSWEGQAHQYFNTGEPTSIRYERYYACEEDREGFGPPVDCLLHFDERGLLVAMLNHYPKGEAGELEQAGNVNLWVRPSHQRRGFASRLLREANNRRKSRETSPRRGADVEKLARISGSTPVQVRATLDVAQADFMQ